jgi:LacI family transcriptional regulator
MVEPGITVVAQPAVELGRRAAALLLRRIEDPDGEPALEILEPSLVLRGSTAQP